MNLYYLSKNSLLFHLTNKNSRTRCTALENYLLIVLVFFSLCLFTSGDRYIRGKLTSGLNYNGISYQHILVTERPVNAHRAKLFERSSFSK